MAKDKQDAGFRERRLRDLQDKSIFQAALDYGWEYLEGLGERDVMPTEDALAALDAFDEPFPPSATPAHDLLRQLHTYGSPAAVAQAGGRYFGFVNGGVLPTALAARILGDFWDQNAAAQLMSPIAAALEAICQRWLVELFGLPAGSVASLTSGSSMASLCGLLAGRNELLRRAGWDVRGRGLFGAPPLRVVLSSGAHATVRRALTLLGIGAAQIIEVAADAQGRFDRRALPQLDANTLLILQAGNVNSGAFDHFEPLCAAAREARAWTHIDGAFGLWARACAETAHLTAGIELADSWSVDAHKTLNSPYDCGIALCRDGEALRRALSLGGAYLPGSGSHDGMLLTPEMSRRARSIELWAALKSLGSAGIDDLVAQLCRRARQFAAALAADGFRILNDVAFNQVLVACDRAELTAQTLARLQAGGDCWCGGTQWQDAPAIRISVCSWMTSEEDVQRSARAFSAARQAALRAG